MVMAQKQTHRSLGQDTVEFRYKPILMWSINLPQKSQEYIMVKKKVSSINGVGKTGHLHTKE